MASERNNGILIGGKRPEYVHSAQGTGLRRILGLPALVFFGLVYMVRESEINQKGKARKLWDIEEGKGI